MASCWRLSASAPSSALSHWPGCARGSAPISSSPSGPCGLAIALVLFGLARRSRRRRGGRPDRGRGLDDRARWSLCIGADRIARLGAWARSGHLLDRHIRVGDIRQRGLGAGRGEGWIGSRAFRGGCRRAARDSAVLALETQVRRGGRASPRRRLARTRSRKRATGPRPRIEGQRTAYLGNSNLAPRIPAAIAGNRSKPITRS